MSITQEWLSCSNEELKKRMKVGYTDPAAVQKQLLFDMLQESAQTEIGRKYDFASILSVDEYRRRMPLMDWHDVEPYSNRMAKGETDLIFPGKTRQFVCTSSTTGSYKLIPESIMSEKARDLIQKLRYAQYIQADHRLLSLFSPHTEKVRAVLPLVNAPSESKTEAGIRCVYASGLTVQSAGLNNMMAFPFYILSNSNDQARDYLIMRLAIASSDMCIIVGNNAGRMTALVRMAEQNQTAIIQDIEQGTITGAGIVDAPIREKLEQEGWLKPMPERAATLRALLAEGKPFHPSCYWPRLNLSLFWLSASVGRYVDELRPYLPAASKVMDVGYGSSEAKFNIPLVPEDPSGALSIATTFFEFQRIGAEDSTQTLLAHELQDGEQYELIVTTWGGLYRYKMKDIVEVKGFIGKNPKIEFVTKSCEVLNICGEKLYPRTIAESIKEALVGWGLSMRQLQIYPDLKQRHYICYVELIEDQCLIDNAALTAQVHELCLQQSSLYEIFLAQGMLKPIEVCLMKSGWQETLYAKKLRAGLSTTQIKLPTVIAEPADAKWIY